MSKIALLAMFLCLVSLCLGLVNANGHRATVNGMVRTNGLPAFSAAWAGVRGHRLVVTDLDPVEPQTGPRQLHERVLLYCGGQDMLFLWVAKCLWDMQQASPFLGYEGPGKRLLQIQGNRIKKSLVFQPFFR